MYYAYTVNLYLCHFDEQKHVEKSKNYNIGSKKKKYLM